MTSKNSTLPSVGSTASGAHKRNSDDIGWEYGFCLDKNKMDTKKCISGLPRFKKVLDQAKKLTIFIYAHHKTLAMMRNHTKKREIIRPRFNTERTFDEDFESDNDEKMFEEDEYESDGVQIVEELED
ncbi:unnamed protein product [Lactuca virosa]|uniref:Uncharacterized protein n=1 Tax=Lactuca virosa TaxID=75947 RepID=A0AAU9LVI4_9ASTR|nr:unnamed protein product [Lactuca virosa]